MDEDKHLCLLELCNLIIKHTNILSLCFFILFFVFLEVALKATWRTRLMRQDALNKQQKMQRRQEEDNISSGVDRSNRHLSWNMRGVLNLFFSSRTGVNAVPYPQKLYSLQAISSAKYSNVSSTLLVLNQHFQQWR